MARFDADTYATYLDSLPLDNKQDFETLRSRFSTSIVANPPPLRDLCCTYIRRRITQPSGATPFALMESMLPVELQEILTDPTHSQVCQGCGKDYYGEGIVQVIGTDSLASEVVKRTEYCSFDCFRAMESSLRRWFDAAPAQLEPLVPSTSDSHEKEKEKEASTGEKRRKITYNT